MPRRKSYGIKGIRIENGRVVYRPYIPHSERHDGIRLDSRGQLSPPVRLGKVGDPDDKIMAAYLAAKANLKQQLIGERNTLHRISKQYQDSRQFRELAPSSQRAAWHAAKILQHPIALDGKMQTVADLHITEVDKPLFQKITENRYKKAQDEGRKGAASINREIAYVSAMISWATNYIPNLGIDRNPLIGFRRLPEQGRTRHVSDDEYWTQYHIAAETPENGLCIVFELTLGLAARGAEALHIKVSDCTEQGILVHRLKGSKNTLIEWSAEPDIPKEQTRLYRACQAALERHKGHKILPIDPPLILTRKGERLSPSGLQSAMQRLKQKMKARGLERMYWTVHELKHKAITEAKDKRIAGHKTEAMRQKYDHSVERFKPGI